MAGALQDRVGLVTGASSGIGRAIAAALAVEGATVVAASRRQDRLADLVREVGDRGGRIVAHDLDVTDERSCRAAVQRTADEFGGLDILVNNAGLMLLGQIDGADPEDWRRMIDTNLLGLMYMTHAALPHLVPRRGTIVQMSSIAGRFARAGNGAYAATKFGVNAFSESLRQEVAGQGVRIVVVEPGVVDTELRTHITQQAALERIEATAASMRQLQPQDIATAVLYAVIQPDHVSVNELFIRPTDQTW